MATAVTIGFDTEGEILDGKGWTLTYLNDSGVNVTSKHTTWANVTGVAQDVFSDDLTIDAFFYERAVDQLVAANLATVATNKSNLRTADGLDATP